jgi:hypothetical protein
MIKGTKFAFIQVFYSLVFLFICIYTFSQIDLNLTLSSNNFYQSVQKQLLYLGYFNRPLSALIFLFLLTFFSIVSLFSISLVKKNIKGARFILSLISIIIFFSIFSYPAFSHDIFNYIFDARIVTKYHANPYLFKALDFTTDTWVRFMHWTHRTYPYGPVWLFVTIPFSFLGFGKFVLTLVNFKCMFIMFYLGNIYLINKILGKINPRMRLLGISIFALNPLVIIESLISPHNESIMLFFLLLSVYCIVFRKNIIFSVIALFVSAGVKYSTIVLFPLIVFWNKLNLRIDTNKIIKIILLMLLIPLFMQIFYREPYGWYFIPIIGIAALIPESSRINNLIMALSIGFLTRYLPYLYFGVYTENVYLQSIFIIFIPVVLYFLWILSRITSRKSNINIKSPKKSI